jgi:hypothetical protein
MIRTLGIVAVAAVFGGLCLLQARGAQGDKGAWGTIKGRVVWGGRELPKPEKINVTVDKLACLAKGDLFDTLFEVNPRNKGFKNVFVALKQPPAKANVPLPVHPDLKEIKERDASFDQPHCLFIPRAVAIREGQRVIAKNSANIVHNVRWVGVVNTGGSLLIPAKKQAIIKNLVAEEIPLTVQCNIHGWMSARLAVYDHPYFAVTDADGNFEIKLAPAGAYRLTLYHEGIGFRGGAKGRAGQEITIKPGGVIDLGEITMSK